MITKKIYLTLIALLATVVAPAQDGVLNVTNLSLVWSQVMLRPHRDAGVLVNYIMNAIAGDRDNYLQNLDWAERHLLDPTDSLYCEEMMTMLLEHATECNTLTADERLRPQLLLENLSRNRIGTMAAPLLVERLDKSSFDPSTQPDCYKLLLFYDPTCDDCERVMLRIADSDVIGEMVAAGSLAVTGVYGGNDVKAWRKHPCPPPLATTWSRGLYDDNEDWYVPSYPMMYLLATDGTVLIKNEPSLNRMTRVLETVRTAGSENPALLARDLFNLR